MQRWESCSPLGAVRLQLYLSLTTGYAVWSWWDLESNNLRRALGSPPLFSWLLPKNPGNPPSKHYSSQTTKLFRNCSEDRNGQLMACRQQRTLICPHQTLVKVCLSLVSLVKQSSNISPSAFGDALFALGDQGGQNSQQQHEHVPPEEHNHCFFRLGLKFNMNTTHHKCYCITILCKFWICKESLPPLM